MKANDMKFFGPIAIFDALLSKKSVFNFDNLFQS